MSINKKVCLDCKIEKSLSEFHVRNKNKGTLNVFCKECACKRQKIWYETHKERHLIHVNESRERRAIYLKKYIKRIKLFFGCSVCGYKKCASSLDFHHMIESDKLINISKVVNRLWTMKKTKKEIRKCVLLCKNCHQELHEGVIKI
jgi:hypothetical protein